MRSTNTFAIILMTAVWLPLIRFVFPPPEPGPQAEGLAQTQLSRWQDAEQARSEMRLINPEWDFMERTFTVLGLANYALKQDDQAARAGALAVIDTIIDDTLKLEEQLGGEHFMLAYSRHGSFRNDARRSLFIDGEILMMLAARELVTPHGARDSMMDGRAELIGEHLTGAPLLSGESYPNECWTFCNTTALAALRLYDASRADRGAGERHRALAERWVQTARARLIEPRTGLLVSSFSYDGTWRDGPEGSSLWMSAHNLRLIDDTFARDQYRRARQHLRVDVLGFGLAREWPASLPGGVMDVDSGPVVPLLGASPGSSGLALLAAASFGDGDYSDGLQRSLQLTAFPIERDGQRSFAAAGHMGDAVALYAAQQGPLWALARARMSAAPATATTPLL